MNIIDFVKFLGGPDSYCMHTKQGDITIRTIDEINSQTKFRALVRAATKVVIPKVAKRVWVNRRQKILQICEDVGVKDPSHPSHPVQETKPWLHYYILSKRCVLDDKEWAKAPQKECPFLRDGLIHISLKDFSKWLEVNLGQRLNRYTLALRMVGVKAERVTVNAKDKDKKNNPRTSWSVWKLPGNFQPPQRDEEGGETGPEL